MEEWKIYHISKLHRFIGRW